MTVRIVEIGMCPAPRHLLWLLSELGASLFQRFAKPSEVVSLEVKADCARVKLLPRFNLVKCNRGVSARGFESSINVPFLVPEIF